MTSPLVPAPQRILVVAPSRYPIREPHAGGLEAMVWDRVRRLRAAGHDVTLVAARGSDFLDRTPRRLRMPPASWGGAAASDETYPAGYLDAVDMRHRRLLDHLREHRHDYDLVENHSLHPMPVLGSGEHGIPMVTTLHTPPLPELVAAAAHAGAQHSYLAVSAHTASRWREHGVAATVRPNPVDPHAWPLGAGGPGLVWFGRIVPEKGPHLAIDAATMLERPITVAGRVGDADYFAREVAPRASAHVTILGALRRQRLADLVGESGCALVTPRWDEPFGLVLAEALMTGTPVAAFARGGVPEVLDGLPGARLVVPDDVVGLAAAAEELLATTPDERERIREHALRRFASLDMGLGDLVALARERSQAPAAPA